MTHYLDDAGRLAAMPGPAGRLAAHLGAIVTAVSARRPGVVRETPVPCRRRPARRPCPGRILAVVELGSSHIVWRCPACEDNGLIHEWQDTPWDRRARPTGPRTPRVAPLDPPRPPGAIRRVLYAHARLARPADAAVVPLTPLPGDRLPPVAAALASERLAELAGTHGEPWWGQPIQYERLAVEHDGGRSEIVVFNRAIALFQHETPAVLRLHRALVVVHDAAGSRPGR